MRQSPLITLSVVCLLSAGCFNSPATREVQTLGSRIVFDYHPLTDTDVDYLSKFDIIVTHNLESKSIVKRLKASRGKIFFYEWLTAFYYVDKPGPWERMVYMNRDKWTLDPRESDPNPMGDRLHCKDFFYDMGNDDLIEQRVNYLADQAKSHGYDGIFFDWGSGWHSLQENGYTFLTKEFERRHPEKKYNDGVNLFLRKLKEKGLLIIVNGGFRSENAEIDRYADVDIVESMFTTDQCDKSSRIDIEKEGIRKACETWFNTLDRALELAERLPKKAATANKDIKFLFLNYAFPYYRQTQKPGTSDNNYQKTVDRQAIYYSLALSYLGNASGFTNGPDVSLAYVMDEVYFKSIGDPAGKIVRLDESTVLRYYSAGFVVASEVEKKLEITLPAGVKTVYDLYGSSRINVLLGKVLISMRPENYPSGAKYPMGRIYIYEY